MQARFPGWARWMRVAILICVMAPLAHAQGVLTVAPGKTLSTTAGTGIAAYTGDDGAASFATLASPSAVAYDASGNLYIADALNHVVRKVSASGTITTLAGTGQAGFGGDGGNATSAYLDTPTGIAIDASGNLYIADSHNHRIRKVTTDGIITTVAGTGVAGFSGDNGAATSARLALPSAVAIDASGKLYIADTNNHRIRKVTTDGAITTMAGNGEELFTGDGGAATSASLDSPTGVAVDATGSVYIADRHNHRIRAVDASGVITTLAGSGTASFAGSFSGEGANATAATLAKPSGVSVDASGNVYIADTDNHRIRQVSNGTIATTAGSGEQGFAGDNDSATSAVLNTPRNVTADSTGNIAFADRLNQRVRSVISSGLSFGTQAVGSVSATRTVTLGNTGNAPLQVQLATFTGNFRIVGGSCGNLPVTIAAGASCTESIAFVPTAAGIASGSVLFSGAGLVPQTLLLSGTAVPAGTTTALASSSASVYQSQAVAFTAQVAPTTAGVPTGTVGIYDSDTLLGTVTLDHSGKATYTTTALAVGVHSITAKYSGDVNYIASTASTISQTILASPGFIIDPVPGTGGSGAGGTGGGTTVPAQTVLPGQAAAYSFTIQAQNAPMTTPVVFSALGLPDGATATFNPPSMTPGLTPSTFTMTIHTPRQTARLRGGAASFAFAVLLLPLIGGRKRWSRSELARAAVVGLLLFALACGVLWMTGCGGRPSGYFANQPKDYVITVIGTADGVDGAMLQRIATVKLTVE